MTSTNSNDQGQGLEEISNLLYLVGREGFTSTNDYVSVSALELVKKQLEKSYKDEVTALRMELEVERKERKENEKRLTRCIEKLMEEVLRFNTKITSVEERIEEIDQSMKPISSSTISTSRSASVELLPWEDEIPGRQASSPKKIAKYKTDKNKAKIDNIALWNTSDSNAGAGGRQVRKSPRKAGPPIRFRDASNTTSSLFLSPSSTASTSTDKDMYRSCENVTDPPNHDGDCLDNDPTSSIVPKAKDQTHTKEINRNIHRKSSRVGRYLPFLCVCGLEFDSESNLFEHTTEKLVEEPNYYDPCSWSNGANNISFQIISTNKKR